MKVAIVEDECKIIWTIELFLKKLGHDVLPFLISKCGEDPERYELFRNRGCTVLPSLTNKDELLVKIQTFGPDIVLLDHYFDDTKWTGKDIAENITAGGRLVSIARDGGLYCDHIVRGKQFLRYGNDDDNARDFLENLTRALG